MDLSAIFGSFAGREVPLEEKSGIIATRFAGPVRYTSLKLHNKNDPVVAAMKEAAEQNGLKFQLCWPGCGGNLFFRKNRVNAHIEKASDGKWRVARFEIG